MKEKWQLSDGETLVLMKPDTVIQTDCGLFIPSQFCWMCTHPSHILKRKNKSGILGVKSPGFSLSLYVSESPPRHSILTSRQIYTLNSLINGCNLDAVFLARKEPLLLTGGRFD